MYSSNRLYYIFTRSTLCFTVQTLRFVDSTDRSSIIHYFSTSTAIDTVLMQQSYPHNAQIVVLLLRITWNERQFMQSSLRLLEPALQELKFVCSYIFGHLRFGGGMCSVICSLRHRINMNLLKCKSNYFFNVITTFSFHDNVYYINV